MATDSPNIESNLFDKFNAGKHVRYQILSCLNANEIHGIVSNVDTDWHNLCKSTFNHSHFTYTFMQYFSILLKNPQRNFHGKIYVQCPWNHLWSFGKIISINHDGMAVKVKSIQYNPFLSSSSTDDDEKKNINESKESDFKESKTSDSKQDESKTSSEYTIVENTLRFDLLNKKQNNRNRNKNKDNNDGYFHDGVHHIAPFDFTVINKQQNIMDELKTNTERDYFERGLVDVLNPFIIKDKEKIQMLLWQHDDLHKKQLECDYVPSDSVLKREYEKAKLLHDLKKPYEIKLDFGSWGTVDVVVPPSTAVGTESIIMPDEIDNKNGEGESEDDDGWLCGIVDYKALNFVFPKWREWQFEENDQNWYQIPVLIDITEILIKCGMPKSMELYRNVFKYGNYRYFKRIWFDPNDKNVIRLFGTKSSKLKQYQLLGTPALSTSPTKVNISYKKIVEQSRLSYKELFNNYLIKLDEKKDKDMKNYSKQQLFTLVTQHDDKMICFEDINGKFEKAICVQYLQSHNKYEIDIITFFDFIPAKLIKQSKTDVMNNVDLKNGWDARIRNMTVNFESIVAEKVKGKVKENEKAQEINIANGDWMTMITDRFYTPGAICARPVINFDVYKDSRLMKVAEFLRISGSNELDKRVYHHPRIICVKLKAKNMGIRLSDEWNKDWDNKLLMYKFEDDDDDDEKGIQKKDNCLWPNLYQLNLNDSDNEINGTGRDGIIPAFGSCEKVGPLIRVMDMWRDRVSSICGQVEVLTEITKEFEEFEKAMSLDWAMSKKNNKNENQSDDYSREYIVDSIFRLNKEKKIFYSRWIHLDDQERIARWPWGQ